MEEISIGIARLVAVVVTITMVGDRDSIITDAAEAEIDTGETGTTRNGRQTETMDSWEETGVIA